MSRIIETQDDRMYDRSVEIAEEFVGEPCENCGELYPEELEVKFRVSRYWRGWQVTCPACRGIAEIDEY